MELDALNSRGQVTIEFLLIVLIILVYIQGVVQPSIDFASNTVQDVSQMAQTRASAQKLANSINEIASSSGEAVKTIHVFVPENGNIDCTSGTTVNFELEALDDESCPSGDCSGSLELLQSVTCDIGKNDKGLFKVIVKKKADGSIVVVKGI